MNIVPLLSGCPEVADYMGETSDDVHIIKDRRIIHAVILYRCNYKYFSIV